jgi:hypothetical protein
MNKQYIFKIIDFNEQCIRLCGEDIEIKEKQYAKGQSNYKIHLKEFPGVTLLLQSNTLSIYCDYKKYDIKMIVNYLEKKFKDACGKSIKLEFIKENPNVFQKIKGVTPLAKEPLTWVSPLGDAVSIRMESGTLIGSISYYSDTWLPLVPIVGTILTSVKETELRQGSIITGTILGATQYH